MKKGAKIIVSIVILIFVIGAGSIYILYDKASNYIIEETLTKQMTKELIEKTGIDLSESGRVLTPEETERFKSVLNTKQDIASEQVKEAATSEKSALPDDTQTPSQPVKEAKPSKEVVSDAPKQVTTDDLKGAIKQQAEAITRVVPSQDKSAMLKLVLSNLTSNDISYLTSLVLDGVSSSDIAEAKRIAKERFSSHELEQVKGYYDKYKHLIP